MPFATLQDALRAAVEADKFASLEAWRIAAFSGWQFVRTQVEKPPSFRDYLRRFGLVTKAIGATEVNETKAKARALEARMLALVSKR